MDFCKLGSIQCWKISWLAEKRLASEKGPPLAVERLVGYVHILHIFSILVLNLPYVNDNDKVKSQSAYRNATC
jgi:hypothetical protein